MSNGIREESNRDFILEPDGFEDGVALQGRLEGGLTERNIPRFDIGGLEGDLTLRAEDLEELVNEGQLGKRLRQVVQQQEWAEAVFFESPGGRDGRFLQRPVDVILQRA